MNIQINTMTLQQFKHLSEEGREYVLSTKAVHIASIEGYDNCLDLFQVDSFYLEVESLNHSLLVIHYSLFTVAMSPPVSLSLHR